MSHSGEEHSRHKKLLEKLSSDEDEENESKLVHKDQQLNSIEEENYSFSNNATCWVCNGFYGPNYDEPTCGICHAFLYTTELGEEYETTISDDEDSGNDEPPFKDKQDDDEDNNAVNIVDHEVNSDNIHDDVNSVVNVDDNKQVDNDVQKELSLLAIQRPNPTAPRSLPHYLELLSDARKNRQENQSDSTTHISALPVEIMVMIFSNLDDMSMWKASEVCQQWHDIIEKNTSQVMWKKYLKERWPLFNDMTNVPNWLNMYGALMYSCFCRTCLVQMAFKSPSAHARQNVIRLNYLRNDIYLLNSYATEGIEAIPLDKENNQYWQASILGPAGSPYEGGKFYLFIFLPDRYPMIPPTVRFLTKILHPNVSRHGDVGIDIFQHKWSLALTICKVLLSVQSLLTDPYTEICMEPELGYMYENNRERFERLARRWTWKYAILELMPPN
ncbi:uncharacterized protein LOC119662093 [Teleopsis dalmanni]|uniref:uncharacterized protein LOC119662093 n=1 Tax=Teleopsis dalmanni TaxID=139649 RepID=UPI0018CD3994|nr:uncharacterized protein LOC119662093 [Teleopsis dalmanni]